MKAQHMTYHSCDIPLNDQSFLECFDRATRLFRTVHHMLVERYVLVIISDVLLYLRHVHSCTKHAWAASYYVLYHLVIVNCNILRKI